jgi:hypothetical protein
MTQISDAGVTALCQSVMRSVVASGVCLDGKVEAAVRIMGNILDCLPGK